MEQGGIKYYNLFSLDNNLVEVYMDYSKSSTRNESKDS